MDEQARDGEAHTAGRSEGMPRWVKVSLVVVLALAVVLLLAQLIGGGGHGPGRHIPSGSGDTPSVITGHTPAAHNGTTPS